MAGHDLTEADFTLLRRQMVEDQLRARGIRDLRVLEAMRSVPRHFFVLEADKRTAYDDGPLPIALDQTISQPYMVAKMTELLELSPGDRVLEVGTGSGYQAAVLAELEAEVWSLERHPELAETAAERLARLGYANVHVKCCDGSRGLPEQAPYRGIVVTAAAPAAPASLLSQLSLGARLVVPVGGRPDQSLRVIRRTATGYEDVGILACRFVPLVGEEGYKY